MAAVQLDCTLYSNPHDPEAGSTHGGGIGGDRESLSRLEILSRRNGTGRSRGHRSHCQPASGEESRTWKT